MGDERYFPVEESTSADEGPQPIETWTLDEVDRLGEFMFRRMAWKGADE